MALNKEVFRVRAISSLFFVVIMLLGLLWNPWSFLVLFSIIHFGCWREYIRLMEAIYNTAFNRLLQLGLMVFGFGIMIGFCGPVYQLAGFTLAGNLFLPLSLAGFILMVAGLLQNKQPVNVKAMGAAALGWLYISFSLGTMLSLRQEGVVLKGSSVFIDLGWIYPVTLILAIWANDTFAYLVGSFIGKTPFSKISPKKTWEGTIGGFVLAVVGMGTLGSFLITGKFSWHAAVLAGVAGLVGTIGDLLESKIKRLAGVKDSGTMLPGHGGFMDRFDSLLLATPFVWLLVKLFY